MSDQVFTVKLHPKEDGARLTEHYAEALKRDLRALATTLHGRGFTVSVEHSGPTWPDDDQSGR